jgi:uncharacterized protein (DUF433 family)
VTIQPDDIRFEVPLYTVAEAARFLDVPASTFSTWAKGYVRKPPGRLEVTGAAIVSSVSADPGYPTIPFVGLAEGMVLAAFRRAGVSLQQIRRAVSVLTNEMRLDHALASERLYTDGAVILFDYAETEDEHLAGLTEVVSRQKVFAPVVVEYLKRISYAPDGWAQRLTSPATERAVILADPRRVFGRPIFARGAAPVESVIGRWKAGESIAHVAEDFGVPAGDIEDYLRAAFPVAA